MTPPDVGSAVYSGKDASTANGKTVSAVSGQYEYGNNNRCAFFVPMAITVDGTVYDFAGYNMTIQSRATLITKYNNAIYNGIAFHRTKPLRNDWASSEIRDWLNTNGTVPNASWLKKGTSNTIVTGVIDGFLGRLSDSFLNSVCPTVNPTWVHPDWLEGKTLDANHCEDLENNHCEDVVDRFWLLGEGNVNCESDLLND